MYTMYSNNNYFFEDCIDNILIDSADIGYVSESAKDFFTNIIESIKSFFKKISDTIKNKITESRAKTKIDKIKQSGIRYINTITDGKTGVKVDKDTAFVKGKLYDTKEVKKIFTNLLKATEETSKKILKAKNDSELSRIESEANTKIKNIESELSKIKPLSRKISVDELEKSISLTEINALQDLIINQCNAMKKEAEMAYSKIVKEDVNDNSYGTSTTEVKKVSTVKKIANKFVACAKKIGQFVARHPIISIAVVCSVYNIIDNIKYYRNLKYLKNRAEQIKSDTERTKRRMSELDKSDKNIVAVNKFIDDIGVLLKEANKETDPEKQKIIHDKIVRLEKQYTKALDKL